METLTRNLEINAIPAGILSRLNANQIVLIASEELGHEIWGTTTFDPKTLGPINGLSKLAELRESEGVYCITIFTILLNQYSIDAATEGIEHRFRIAAELEALLRQYADVYITYVVTHYNSKPMDEMTVFIGGDCYRSGVEIKDLKTVLGRTKHLAEAMIRKAVMVFPDIPALHGGKKGEWIITDREGNKIEGLSTEAIVALGTLIIPKGITFLNEYKEQKAIAKKVFDAFPKKNHIRPDTASPDVLSGANWRSMCNVWRKRGVDLSYVTCLPENLEGPLVPSSYPTGYGVVATAIRLVHYYFHDRQLAHIRFLLEALGGVGTATVEGLLERRCKPENITSFDKSAEACKRAEDKYGINTFSMTQDEVYRRLGAHKGYDVWINNGEGDNTTPEHIEKLIASGVRIFCGGANNFLEHTTKDLSLQKIFDAGCWAWPDEAASGGGWTLAVVDVLTRAIGKESNTTEVRDEILRAIVSRNERLVDEIMSHLGGNDRVSGQAIWKRIEEIIDERVRATTSTGYSIADAFAASDVRNWKLA
jgi:glutamate dehydrogenase/leucine dehydrogenase